MVDSFTQINFAGIPLEVHADNPAPGKCRIEVESLDWWAPAVDSTDSGPHRSGMGQLAGAKQTAAKSLTLALYLYGTSVSGPGSPREAMDRLARIEAAELVVTDELYARAMDVRVVSMPYTPVTPLEWAVTAALVADDPLRYSAASRRLVNGTNRLPNRGNKTAFGRLRLVGPHNAITIAHDYGVWTFPALAAGVERRIDFRQTRVWDGAGSRIFGAGAGRVPFTGPGANTWTVAGLGTGIADLTRSEAWT